MLPATKAAAKTWVVNTASDQNYTQWNTTDAVLSLREAIYCASSGDIITFSENVKWYNNTIKLSNGPLEINKNLTIDAGIQYYLKDNTADVIISADRKSRVINISLDVTVKMCGITIRDGYISDGTEDEMKGAGIYNAGTLYLNFCTVTDNILVGSSASGFRAYGGGIYSYYGALYIYNSEINGNSVVAYNDSDQKSGIAFGEACTAITPT